MQRVRIIGPDGKFHDVVTKYKENPNGGTVRVVGTVTEYSRTVFGITKG